MIDNIMKFIFATYSIILPVLAGCIIDDRKKRKKNKDINDTATKLMLRIQLMSIHDNCVAKKYATNEEYQTYVEIWDLYHDGYGGNLLSERHKLDMDKLEIKAV